MRARQSDASAGRAWLPWALLPPILLWLGATVLRESPLFWRNEGGYPLGLRNLVLDSYYPGSVVLVLGCLVAGALVLRRAQTLSRPAIVGWLLLAFGLGLGIAGCAANNVSNLLEGRPLHYHRSARQSQPERFHLMRNHRRPPVRFSTE